MSNSTPTQRAERLYDYFGLQGGTIHQIAELTGVSVDDLLYAPYESLGLNSRYAHGACAAETCGLSYRRELATRVKGDRGFWVGVACSIPPAPLVCGVITIVDPREGK